MPIKSLIGIPFGMKFSYAKCELSMINMLFKSYPNYFDTILKSLV